MVHCQGRLKADEIFHLHTGGQQPLKVTWLITFEKCSSSVIPTRLNLLINLKKRKGGVMKMAALEDGKVTV